MKKTIIASLAALIISAIGFAPSTAKASPLIACIVPTPVCAVAVGVMALIVIKGSKNKTERSEMVTLNLTKEQVDEIAREVLVRDGKDFIIKANRYHNMTPNFMTIVERFGKEQINKLVSLKKWSPGMFETLDEYRDILVEQLGNDVVLDVYGETINERGEVNWEAYAYLAQDLTATLKHTWWVKKNFK